MKIIYLDTETTGLDCKLNDIIQLSGMIEIDGEIKEEFDYKIRPREGSEISEEALEIHGMNREMLMSFPDQRVIYLNFCDLLSKYCNKFDKSDKFHLAGYNVRFDLDFLKSFFEKQGDSYFGSWFNYKCIDPMPLLHFMEYAGYVSLDNYKLENVCFHYGIEIKAHDAMSDIKATKELIEKLKVFLKK